MRAAIVLVTALVASLPTVPAEAEPAPLAVVCFLHCDTLDPSRAGQEIFPVPERDLNGRRLVLHVSDVDGMAWGSVDDGTAGDAVWLDRSWDGGATWEGLLGKAAVPPSWTGTRTLMYNVSDPGGHRRGVIRACGDAGGVACTDWVYPTVCDTRCDRTDPGLADGDVQPVPPTTLFGRTIRLHADRGGLAWGTIEAGGPGDEIWLDRSWDAGVSWPGGSSLGRTSATGAGATTTMFATRDPRGRHYGGAVRACGRAQPYQQGSCTAWARPAPVRAAAAAEALLYSYDPYGGWWRGSWWNSAATLTAVVRYAADTGDRRHDWVIARTFDRNRGTFPAGERGTDPIEGDFVSRSIDDSAWWALAWIAAYDHTGQTRYLDMARTIAEYVHGFWDPATCGGGVWWDRERTYKNAVTAGQYLRLTASLHRRVPGDTRWLGRARTAADWYLASGLVNSANLVNDGLTGDCRNNGQPVWTYNQGLAIGGLTETWRATGETRYLDAARRLADAGTTSQVLTSGGVLTERCDTGQNTCDDNQKQFKGIFVRYLADLASVTGSPAYEAFLRTQADTVWSAARDPLNRLGQRWAGGDPNPTDWRTQASALEALTAE